MGTVFSSDVQVDEATPTGTSFPVPRTVKILRSASIDEGRSSVSEHEFEWMIQRRPLVVTEESLRLDYGEQEAHAMLSEFSAHGLEKYQGALNWPGVGTRWRQYLNFLREEHARDDKDNDNDSDTRGTAAHDSDANGALTDVDSAFRAFGNSLGRVLTYRALALDDAAYKAIMKSDFICPSGQLRVSEQELANVVETKGVRTIAVARLFIAHLARLLGHDPSISLHDDWQTTTLIASGYSNYDRRNSGRSKRVHLFEVSCPVVESLGWTLHEVALQAPSVLGGEADREPWFNFPAPALPEGCWFDGRLQRTERYSLYGLPFLRERLKRCFVFNSSKELTEALRPFANHQAELHARDCMLVERPS